MKADENNEIEYWIHLLKKTGLYIPTPEEADSVFEDAVDIEPSQKLKKTIVSAMPSSKRAEATAILGIQVPNPQVNISKDRFFRKLKDIIARIGVPEYKFACEAMNEFLGQVYFHQHWFYEFVRELLSEAATVEDNNILREAVRKFGPSASVAAFYKQQERVSPEEALSWLGHESTEISTFVSTPYRRIFFAKVDKSQVTTLKHFKALWLKLTNECHIVLVSMQHANTSEIPDAIWHDLDHIRRHYFSLGNEKKDIEMSKNNDELITEQQKMVSERIPIICGTEIPPFAMAQSGVDPEEKQLEGLWVSQHLRLQNGAGIIIDAGSSCLEVWRAIVDQIDDNQFAFLNVYTNSYQVLEHWRERLNSRQVQQTKVQLIAGELDAEHLAFYGPEAVHTVMNPSFRAMNVYIGTSGIEFDEAGRILFGYHAGRLEREIKELLFRCHAQKRIILATPRKIGFAGGLVFNVLEVDELNAEAPIYLVTTNPEKGSENEVQFERAMEVFKSKAMEEAITKKNLEFHWITIDRENGGVPKMLEHIVVPDNAKREIV